MILVPPSTNGNSGMGIGSYARIMYPKYYQAYTQRGLNQQQALKAAYYAAMQTAWESSYGTSNAARTKNNYGGIGPNGKDWNKYKTVDDFINAYADLSMRNGIHKSDTLYDYIKSAKQHGYFTDDLDHYWNNVNGMSTFKKSLNNFSGRYASQLRAQEAAKQQALQEQQMFQNIQNISTQVADSIPIINTKPTIIQQPNLKLTTK